MLSATLGNISEIPEQDKYFYSEDVDFKSLEYQRSMIKIAFKTLHEKKIKAVVHARHVEMQYAGAVRRMLSEVDKVDQTLSDHSCYHCNSRAHLFRFEKSQNVPTVINAARTLEPLPYHACIQVESRQALCGRNCG